MTNGNQKGKRGERELAKKLGEVFGVACRRGQQFCGASGDADVIGLDGIHVECKRTEKLLLWPALDQSVGDAKAGSVPMVFHRPNNRPWIAIVRVDDLPALGEVLASLRGSQAPQNGAELSALGAEL